MFRTYTKDIFPRGISSLTLFRIAGKWRFKKKKIGVLQELFLKDLRIKLSPIPKTVKISGDLQTERANV